MTLRLVCALSFLLLVGCVGSFSRVDRINSPLSNWVETEEALERSFRAMGIPVLETSRDGRVRSGVFDPTVNFGRRWPDRVSCGWLADDEAMVGMKPTHLEVIAVVRKNRKGGVRVEIESYGKGTNEEGKAIDCRLEPSVSQELVASLGRPGFRYAEG